MPGNMLNIAIASSGNVSPRLTQNRRVMSCSSGLASSVTEGVRGSSAIPQIGHVPGPGLTIWGCIGQVYSVLVSETGRSGSSAMPQLGQGPGFSSRTSGHTGHTYSACWATVSCGLTGTSCGVGAPSVTKPFPDAPGFKY